LAKPIWTPEVFEADDGTVPFERFISGLSDTKFAALDAAIEHVLAVRGLELVRTEWLKALGEGLHEFRVRHDADEIARMFGADSAVLSSPPEAILLRIFVHFHGQKVVLLLGGYDKAADPNKRRQQREIDQARRLLTQFRERQRRVRAETARPPKARPKRPRRG
jgi:putative component of toxin-antitoxin plasmid stabilization module